MPKTAEPISFSTLLQMLAVIIAVSASIAVVFAVFFPHDGTPNGALRHSIVLGGVCGGVGVVVLSVIFRKHLKKPPKIAEDE